MNLWNLAPTLITCAIGIFVFFDKYFGTRRGNARDNEIQRLSDQSWTVEDWIKLERRLTKIETDIEAFHQLIELREKIAANILRKDN